MHNAVCSCLQRSKRRSISVSQGIGYVRNGSLRVVPRTSRGVLFTMSVGLSTSILVDQPPGLSTSLILLEVVLFGESSAATDERMPFVGLEAPLAVAGSARAKVPSIPLCRHCRGPFPTTLEAFSASVAPLRSWIFLRRKSDCLWRRWRRTFSWQCLSLTSTNSKPIETGDILTRRHKLRAIRSCTH